jgi:predicted amidohydrolase YtcJ
MPQEAEPLAGAPDLIIVGRIATLTGHRGYGWAEALAVAGGRVLAAGSAVDVEPLAVARTRRWRLGTDLIVTPALCDAHLHLQAAAMAMSQPDLTGLDRAGVSAVIAAAHEERIARGDADGWLLGHGWSTTALGGHPEAAWLDEAAPGRPVALWAHDHHSRWLSSRAIQVAGLAAHPDPRAGRIGRDGEGRPTGILFEAAAGLVDEVIPAPAASDVDMAIGAYAVTLAALGVTSVHDPGGVAPDPVRRLGVWLYHDMARAGRLPLRVTGSIREDDLEAAIEVGFRSGSAGPWTDDGLGGDGGPGGDGEPGADLGQGRDDEFHGRYRDGWLKLFSDGALGSRTAALLSPYEAGDAAGPPPGGPAGMALRTREELAALAIAAAAARIASQIHAIGDAGVRTVLDALAEVPAVPGFRHRVEHAQLVHPDDLDRFAALHVAASVQPCHLLSDVTAMRTAWGARAATAFPLAAMDRAGTLMPFGTDAPVEPADPWRNIGAAVSRRGADWPGSAAFHPEQAVSLDRALRAACLDGPRSAGRSDEGHLGVGARADLIVLPAEPFEGAPDAAALAQLRPLATVLDGSLVHTTTRFDPLA